MSVVSSVLNTLCCRRQVELSEAEITRAAAAKRFSQAIIMKSADLDPIVEVYDGDGCKTEKVDKDMPMRRFKSAFPTCRNGMKAVEAFKNSPQELPFGRTKTVSGGKSNRQTTAPNSRQTAMMCKTNSNGSSDSNSPNKENSPGRMTFTRSEPTGGAASGLEAYAPSFMTTIMSGRSQSVVPRRRADSGDDDAVLRKVEEIEHLVQKLQRSCTKHPSQGKHMFSISKTRYFAAMPAEEPSGNSADSRWQRWYRGNLVWWKDAQSYLKREEPKGSVFLLSIVKVSWGMEEPQEVIVRHHDGNERHEMILHFDTMPAAKEWSATLNKLRKMLET